VTAHAPVLAPRARIGPLFHHHPAYNHDVASSKSRLPSSRTRAVSGKRSSRGRMASIARDSLAFGAVVGPRDDKLAARIERLLKWSAKRADLDLELRESATYEDLANDVKSQRIDVAWLPPIVHLRLGKAVTPLGSILRDGRVTYETALIVPKDSKVKTIASLRGARAGWVDRWSAAGFVLPRVNLALLGIDATSFFRTETFYGSHRAVVRALVDGACDVAGTFAQAGANGKVKGGAWSDVPGAEVRVLATFGAIPPDVIGARSDLDDTRLSALREAFRATSTDAEGKRLLQDAFGGETFVEDQSKSYESLAAALDMATKRGLFE
jgi:phosphonate transport system substrate-binding protein